MILNWEDACKYFDKNPASKTHNVCCPVHSDREASLSITDGGGSKLLLHCHAGCDFKEIIRAMGGRSDAHTHTKPKNKIKTNTSGKTSSAHEGCTLEQYSDHTGLHIDTLRNFGLEDAEWGGKPAVSIPYKAEHREMPHIPYSIIRTRYRINLSGDRFRWGDESKHVPLYGLHFILKSEKVWLVEGESDVQVLSSRGYCALGVAGVGMFKAHQAEYESVLGRFDKIFLAVEPDQGGTKLVEALMASNVKEKVEPVYFNAEHKDALDLHKQTLGKDDNFNGRYTFVRKLLELRESHQSLINSPNILDEFIADCRKSGIVGEDSNLKIIFLALQARGLDQLVHIAIKSSSSVGKSYMAGEVLKFFPPSAYVKVTEFTPSFLFDYPEDLAHQYLVLAEMQGFEEDDIQYQLRTFMSEGIITKGRTVKVDGGFEGQLIEKKGPIGILLTTTRDRLHPENETRMISLSGDESNEQTRNVKQVIADRYEGKRGVAPDYRRWHRLHNKIVNDKIKVIIPFASVLADKLPDNNVRMRRDITKIFDLISTHASLHRENRNRSENGEVIADIKEDYAPARELLIDTISESLEIAVPEVVRETVKAVGEISAGGFDQNVTIKQLQNKLDLSRTQVNRRVSKALRFGHLVNNAEKNKKLLLQVGDALPEDSQALPTAEELLEIVGVQVCTHTQEIEDETRFHEETEIQKTESSPVGGHMHISNQPPAYVPPDDLAIIPQHLDRR